MAVCSFDRRIIRQRAPIVPIGRKFCVLYLEPQLNRRECCSPWFYSEPHAKRALQIIRRRVGEKNAIIYVD